MARSIFLGNGALTVGLNKTGLVHDFYYPYVGQENLTTSRSMRHMIGVFTEGVFSWTSDSSWSSSVAFDDNALVAINHMKNEDLGIELLIHSFVDSQLNIFCRRVKVKNTSEKQREIRLFMHQVFQISHNGRADTALFEPEDNYILDYKGRVTLLAYMQDENGKKMDQHAVGSYGVEGKQGTYIDAEDGELSGSNVEHGGVDSVMRISNTFNPGQAISYDYWVAAADSHFNVHKLHKNILENGLENRLNSTKDYWHKWLGVASEKLNQIEDSYLPLAKRSLMTIKAHIDKRGGIIASCDSSIYNYGRDYYSYVWPRDGASTIQPLIRMGYTEEPQNFFNFCRDVLTSDGYLMHKYQPDKSVGSTWHPLVHAGHKELAIQEDESATIIYSLYIYLKYSENTDYVRSMYGTLIKPIATFLSEYMDEETGLPHASYDLWEEKFGTHTYTVAITYRALLYASELAEMFEFPDDAHKWSAAAELIKQNVSALYTEDKVLRKSLYFQKDHGLKFDDTLDVSSLYGAWAFGLPLNPEDEVKEKTLRAIEERLLNVPATGGSPRYEQDNYFSTKEGHVGNSWIVTTLWIAQHYISNGRQQDALKLLDWSKQHALPSGVLPEQIHPETGAEISVTPLVWSHAEYLNTLLDIIEKAD